MFLLPISQYNSPFPRFSVSRGTDSRDIATSL